MMFLPWQSLKIRWKPFDRTECIYIFFCFPVDGVVDNLKCVAQQIWRLFPSLLLCREDDRGNATMSHRGHKVYCSPQCLFSIMDWKKIKKKINHIQYLCHSLKIMTVFFLKRFLNDWFYCNWVRHMRGKYISWKKKISAWCLHSFLPVVWMVEAIFFTRSQHEVQTGLIFYPEHALIGEC